MLAFGALCCALFLGLIAWQTALDRADRIQREEDALSRMAEIVATDTANMVGRVRFFLATADFWLRRNPAADPRTDPEFRELIEEFRASMGNHLGIRVVSASGEIYNLSSSSPASIANVGDRDYFKAQQSASTRGLYLGAPVKSRVTGTWVIPLSYPLASHNAGMTVVLASLEIEALDSLYDRIRPRPNGSIALIRRDGLILARSPFRQDLAGTAISADAESWWSSVKSAPNGILTLRAQTDGEKRILAARTADSPAFVVSVSARWDDVLAPWRAALWWRAAISALILGAMAAFSAKLFLALRSLGQAQAELASNMERLARSDATKDKLFSVIAHDLRGPIGGMASLLDTMATDKGEMSLEEMGELIDALRSASENTTQLLENLLAWSRSQRGELPFNPERVSLYPIIGECAEVFELSSKEKGVSLDIQVESGLKVRGDAELLKILVRNLISNAVKFSVRGGRVTIEAASAEGGATIAVHDQGIGMGKDRMEALRAAESVRSRPGTANERGSGLGLILCREIAEMHGGSFSLESEPGEGSTFAVFLPDRP